MLGTLAAPLAVAGIAEAAPVLTPVFQTAATVLSNPWVQAGVNSLFGA